MLSTATVRLLDDRDLPAARSLLDRDPVANLFIAARVDAAGLEPRRLGAEVWGYAPDGRLDALCYAGANLVPAEADAAAARAFAERARRVGRRCSSIVGPAAAVRVIWEEVATRWGPARDVRPDQPLLATRTIPQVPADPAVRRVAADEIDVLLPACIAMYTEEVGVSPVRDGGEGVYRSRVQELIELGHAFARIEDGRVVFKAEVGAVTAAACQVQGVWVDPVQRGTGLGTAGMAAVVGDALRTIAPIVSLYVNDYNVPARRAYERVGFSDVGRFMSVLF